MPHIAISLYPGRDDKTKQEIAEQMHKFYVETFGAGQDAVSVSIVEIPGEQFQETIQQRYRLDELYISSRTIPKSD